MPPVYFEEFLPSAEMGRETWRRRSAIQDMFGDAKPNAGHLAVAEWVRRGKVSHVITQDIVNLHPASGVPADQTLEVHDNTTRATCLDGGVRYEIAPLRPLLRGGRSGAR
jgi:NAD-dependent deacetylase